MKKWIDKSIYHIFTFTIHKNRPAPLPTCTSRCRSPAGHQKLPTAHGNPNVDFVLSPDSFLKEKNIPSRELTYPTLGKGKSSSKCHFWGDMLVFRGVFQSQVAEFSILSWWLRLGLGVGVGVGVDCVPTPRAPKWSPPLHQDVFDDRHRAPPFAPCSSREKCGLPKATKSLGQKSKKKIPDNIYAHPKFLPQSNL